MDEKNKYTILAADDSQTCLRTIQEIFKIVGNTNYEFILAGNGRDACKLAVKHMPDLILMDILMPEMNGIQAIKTLRKTEKTKDIPIIVLSATESLQTAFEAGANDFITKPFKHYELLIRVKQALKLVQQMKEIELQKEKLMRQNVVLSKHRDFIAQRQKDILDDINYSKHIQNAILPAEEQIKTLVTDYFIFNRPKNIVSGDFYWVGKNKDKSIIAVADCTGHGISGAFMTMVGVAFLNEIINKYTYTNAAEILDHLRLQVIRLLNQKGVQGEASDGMDISLVMYDEEKKKLQFSGANNPLYLVRNGELQIYKGDRMPIGIHVNYTQSFTNHSVEIQENDVFYMFSDGYADQFGGERDKKFRYKRFREVLLEISTLSMGVQHDVLAKTHDNWKGERLQIDDILVMGFKL